MFCALSIVKGMEIKMGKWAIAGMIYVTVVIFGFQAYNKWIAGDDVAANHVQNMGEHNNNMDAMENAKHSSDETGGHAEEVSHSHGEGLSHNEGSEVNVFVFNDRNNIKILLKDKVGNPIDKLKVNHEKKLHLIIVDEKLQKFYHLHPNRTGEGAYSITYPLPNGYYKAFVDIKPESYAYQVEPVPFVVGTPSTSSHGQSLEPDSTFTKTVDGEEVTLNVSSIKVGKDVKLSFHLDKTHVTPYLGAMGHVVILDEYGKKFLHVHPSNDTVPIFETTFERPGIYKIWAEFKQNGKVRAFPFVIEVKE